MSTIPDYPPVSARGIPRTQIQKMLRRYVRPPGRLLPIQPPRMLCRNLPTERHQRFTVGLAQLRAIQLLDQLRPNRIGTCQRLIAAEAVDFPVVARKQHIRHAHSAPHRRPRVLPMLEQRLGTRI